MLPLSIYSDFSRHLGTARARDDRLRQRHHDPVVRIAAIAIVPVQLSGYGSVSVSVSVLEAANKAFNARSSGAGLLLRPDQFAPFAALVRGSTFGPTMYPHTMTGVIASQGASQEG